MIVLDMDMPIKCMNCQLLGRDAMYCQVYPRKDLNLIKVANGKPNWCPIKCDIEDIKQEIPTLSHYQSNDGQDLVMVADVSECIDKHIGDRCESKDQVM